MGNDPIMANINTSSGGSYTPTSTFPTLISSEDQTTAPPPHLNDTDAAEFLHQKNLENVSSLTPFLVYLILLMLCGLVGNAAVFVVYLTRFRAGSSRTLILSMSLCDLLTNVWALLTEVTEIRHFYTFRAAWFCKVSKTFMGCLVLFSGLVLVAVAVERQKVVCGNYTRNQAVGRMVRAALLICGVVAAGLSLPRAVLYGSRSVTFAEANVTGVQCNIDDAYRYSSFPVVYNAINALVFVVIVMIMGVCYGRVGFHLWRHKKTTRGNQRRRASSASNCGNRLRIQSGWKSDADSSRGEYDTASDHRDTRSASTSDQPSSPTSPSSPSSITTLVYPQEPDSPPPDEAPWTATLSMTSSGAAGVTTTLPSSGSAFGQRIPSRTTLMLVILTVLFVLNFLPYLIVEVLLALAPGSSLWRRDRSLLFFLFRSYYLNSAVNPLVYSFCSAKFRYECRQLFRSLRNWWKRATRG